MSEVSSIDTAIVTPAEPAVSSPPAVLAAPADGAPAPVVKRPVAKKPARPAVPAEPPVPLPAASPAAFNAAKDEMMTDTTRTITDKAGDFLNEAGNRAQGAMEKGQQAFEDVAQFHKGNLEAMAESGRIAARGLEKLGQDAAAYARTSYENASSALKSMAAAKSPTELFKLQSDFARTSFDALIAEGSRSTEAALKLAGEIAQPLSNRVAIAAEKAKVAA